MQHCVTLEESVYSELIRVSVQLDTAVRTEAVIDNIQEEMDVQEIIGQWDSSFFALRAQIFQGFHMLPRRPSWQRKENVVGTPQEPASSPKFPGGSTLTVSSSHQESHPAGKLLITMNHAFSG
jgi:hypothetical protein